jgi:hypothetical protein
LTRSGRMRAMSRFADVPKSSALLMGPCMPGETPAHGTG